MQNRGAGAWSLRPEARWRVVEDLRIGNISGSGPDVFGQVRSVVVDQLGQMWVVDALANDVRVFDVDGAYLRTVGRRGAGPGEFVQVGPAFNGPDGEIWVEDLALSRWERFDTAGVRVGGLRSTSRIRGALRLWTRDDRFLVVDSQDRGMEQGVFAVYGLAGPDSLVREAFFPFPEVPEPALMATPGEGGMPVPFTMVPWMEVTSDGEIWVTHRAHEYMIRRQTLSGETLQITELAYEPVPVPRSVRERVLAELDSGVSAIGAIREEQVPHVYPPFESFYVSTDGYLWVLRTLEGGRPGLDVFAGNGRYLGQLLVPADLVSMRIQRITANHIYAVAEDTLGVNYVVRLTVERGVGLPPPM